VLRQQGDNSVETISWSRVLFKSYGSSAGRKIPSGVALGYRLDDRGFETRRGMGISLFTTVSRPALGLTQPPNQWVPGALSVVKRLGREADHSPSSSVELYSHSPSTPSWRGTQLKHRGNFTFTFMDSVFIVPLQWTLSWARWIQSTGSHPMTSILILYLHLRIGLRSGIFFKFFRLKFVRTYHLLYKCYMAHPHYTPSFYHSNNISRSVQITKLLIM
jgi:hypothetical protein